MARTTLTPVILTADSGALLAGTASTNYTAAGTGAGNGVTFNNIPGQSLLLVQAGTGQPGTATVIIGQTVLGQAVTSFSVPVILTGTNQIAVLGPFHSVLDAPGTAQVSIDFTFSAGTPSAMLVQIPGVY